MCTGVLVIWDVLAHIMMRAGACLAQKPKEVLATEDGIICPILPMPRSPVPEEQIGPVAKSSLPPVRNTGLASVLCF